MRNLCLLGILSLAVAGPAAIASDEREEKLPEAYRKWLREEVTYIISKVERETFLSLETETEREAFLDAFWRKRDENPATPENEYEIEHYARLAYANEFFGRDTFRPGWQTDRGRYYILLGKPNTRLPLEGKDEIYPCELWFYNDPDLKYVGLPPFFYLLFFRRYGSGELQLYSPISDGPQALLTGFQAPTRIVGDEVERAYNRLLFIDPELAQASLSFRTDEGDTAQFQNPSFGTLSLLGDIADSPFHGLDTSYAERLDFERGSVESDYLFTYVPSFGVVKILPGPHGAFYLHWGIELDAEHVGFVRDEDKNQYASVFIASIEIVLREDENRLVLEERRESFMTLSEGQAKNSLQLPFAYSGMVPLVPGGYKTRIVLRNRACPGRDESNCLKSYTLLESDVNVPEWQEERPELSEMVLAYGTEIADGEPQYRPFRFGKVEVLPNPREVYAIGDSLVAFLSPLNAPAGSRVRLEVVGIEGAWKTWVEKTVEATGWEGGPLIQQLSLAGLEGGRFELVATLLDSAGSALDHKVEGFTVSPRTSIARPGVRGSIPPARPEVPGVVPMVLGEQYLRIDAKEKARAHLERAIRENPRLGPARELLASLLLDGGEIDGVLGVLEPTFQHAPDRFEVLALLGQAYFHKKEFGKSAELLEKAYTLRRLEPRLLNVLAIAQHELGNDTRAVEVLERSLSLNPDQPPVKDLLERLKAGPAAPPSRS